MNGRMHQEQSFMKLLSKGRWSMELNERAKLLLAKAKDDETLLMKSS